ncbi:Hypothetical predicted protein, partial [Olea europaea subsp. europaea]
PEKSYPPRRNNHDSEEERNRTRTGQRTCLRRDILTKYPNNPRPLPITPAFLHYRSGSRSRPRLTAKLTREIVVVTTKLKTISRQNVAMRKLLKRMQGQLANPHKTMKSFL